MAFRKWDGYHGRLIVTLWLWLASLVLSCPFPCPVSPPWSDPSHHLLQPSSVSRRSTLLWSECLCPPASPGSCVCCYKWLRRCVLWAFPFVDKPFISVGVVDWCLEPKWHAWWRGNACMPELPAVLRCPRACVAGVAHWPFGSCWCFLVVVVCLFLSFCFFKQKNNFWVALLFLIHFYLFNDHDVMIWFDFKFVEIVVTHW